MLCKDLMTKNVIKGYKFTSVLEVCELMHKNNIGFLPIVYEDTDFIAGVITDRDIINRVICKEKSMNTSISDVMSPKYISVLEDDDITIAISKMADYQIKRIICTNKKNQISGIISIKDIALNQETNRYLNDLLKELCTPNPQIHKPQEYLRCEDFPL